MTTKSLTDYSYEELLEAIKSKAQAEVKPKTQVEIAGESMRKVLNRMAPTLQERRDKIVEQAKRDVADLKTNAGAKLPGTTICFWPVLDNECETYVPMHLVEFVVNRKKRTVVAVIKSKFNRMVFRGIAKCDPSDCFNSSIGKAIALRRALGLEVPAEYLNAPQPTEVRVGDVVKYRNADRPKTVVPNEMPTPLDKDITRIALAKYGCEHYGTVIIDDTHEGE